MSYATPIDSIIGGEAAATLVLQIAAELEYSDRLPARTAFRLACETVADGNPRFIAAPGQVWVARPELAAGLLVSRFAVKRRDSYNTIAVVVPVDGPLAGVESEVELHDLAQFYELEAWLPIDPDLARPLANHPGELR
ncbi:hypothetical protein [Streptacidiphilus sp. EB129]|uniref:hypothetical protein n=1 Tax=Streptacidiphilus sp. EB129 TaxID=3156262 RepID=UPI003515B3EB